MNQQPLQKPVKSPQKYQHPLEQPFLRSSSGRPERQIDVVRLVNKQQESRVTKINFNSYQPYKKIQKESSIQLIPLNKLKLSEEDEYDQNIYAAGIISSEKEIKKPARLSRMSEHQTFITSYQNNTIVGLALYLLFISFLAAETLTISYLTTKNQRNKQFHIEKTLIVILTAEVFYYLLIRLLNYKSQKKFLKKSTIIGSFHKIIANSQLYHSQPSETKDQHPYLHLTILTVTLIASQIIFSILVSQSIFIYHPEEENYLVSSIFWSAFALPYLFEHFYLSEVLYHDNPKQNFQFFPYIILAFMLETLLEGAFFLIFIVLKLINIYIQVKQSYYMLHINFVINSTLLIFTIFYVLLKFQNNDNGHLFSWHTVQNIWHVLLTGAIVTCSMLVSRFIGLFFLKQQLNKYFYTQMYIQLAFVFTTMLLYLSYIPQIQSNQNVQSITILLPLLFLLTVGFIVYKQGKQKLQVNMDLPNEEY